MAKTTYIGQAAESEVIENLKSSGYFVVDRNWKTKVCEIDIIAQKSDIIYFVEVKYRSSLSQGDGLAYITPQKLRKLHFSAQVWTQFNNWTGDYRLLAASVSSSGTNFIVEDIVELD